MTKAPRKSSSPDYLILEQAEFLDSFEADVEEWEAGFDFAYDVPSAHTLVLGAGASRSAGVPTQTELEFAMEVAHREYLRQNPSAEFDDSVLEDWEALEQRLLMTCLSRAHREPNLTQLLAADLASVGFLGPILTTNFDDLMLAAFWSLPHRTFHVEPHVIYDPRRAWTELRNIKQDVPLVIKAHGHHTMYRLARFQHQVRRLIPSVLKLYSRCPQPLWGFIVVGYSGLWNDGIMAILSDKKLARRKRVYWLFKGDPPKLNKRLNAVIENCDFAFVRINDSDEVFVQMWERLTDSQPYLGDKMLGTSDLFAPIPMSERGAFLSVGTNQPKWRHGIEYVRGMTSEMYWALPAIKALQEKFVPILTEMDALEGKTLVDELLRVVLQGAQRRPTLTRVHTPDDDEYVGIDELRLDVLKAKLPSGLEWTRRNRRVFLTALSGKIDHLKSIELLEVIQELTEQAIHVE